MGEQNLNIRIKHKYDTEANWNKNNPVTSPFVSSAFA